MSESTTDVPQAAPLKKSALPVPRHQSYIETRGSTGAWLFGKKRARVEVLNDSDGAVLNLSHVLINQRDRVELITRYAASAQAMRVLPLCSGDDKVARAATFAIQASKALRKLPSACYRLHRREPLELDSWLRPLDHVMERLRKVQIEDGSTIDLLRRYDWPQAFFLCDERQRTWDEHDAEALGQKLRSATGKVALIVGSRPGWLSDSEKWRSIPGTPFWVNY